MPRPKLFPKLLNLAVFIALEAAALGMLARYAPLQRVWVSRAAHGFMGSIWGGSQQVREYFGLKKRNKLLAQENTLLLQELERSRELLRQARLDTMAFPRQPGFRMIHAEVLQMSHNSQHNYLILNKGYEDGIQEKSGIITPLGVVGIVEAISAHTCYAFGFRNRDVSISARIGREGGTGILVWDGHSRSGALLKEIPLQYKYQPGDTVYTSGHSLLFPPDIPLGITGKARVVNGATNEISVQLLQDPTSVRYVTVVHNNSFDEIEEFQL